jgi:hypothetical protein
MNGITIHDGCAGTCGQGRQPCDCACPPVLRETRPADLLPTSSDPAEAVTGAETAVIFGILALALVAFWSGIAVVLS